MKKKLLLAVALLVGVFTQNAFANHAWGNYHWARNTVSFTLKLGNNLSNGWRPFLDTTVFDWSLSNVLDLVVVASNKNPRNCTATLGRGEVCNAKYGNNGWLGIAQIWASGEHITQGVVKMNDTYFNTSSYNTTAWKNLVMCQEVGHILGLDHQDEVMTNANLDTCMDYTNNPGSNQHPNQHDYDMLATMYAHMDAGTTVAQSTNDRAFNSFNGEDKNDWGQEVRRSKDGRASLFAKDFGNGKKVFTHVFWVEEGAH